MSRWLLGFFFVALPFVVQGQGGISFVYEEREGAKVMAGIKYDGKVFRNSTELYNYQATQLLSGRRNSNSYSRGRSSTNRSRTTYLSQSEKRKIESLDRAIREQIRKQEEKARLEQRAQTAVAETRHYNQQMLNQALAVASYNQNEGTRAMMVQSDASLERRQQVVSQGNYTAARPMRTPGRTSRANMLRALASDNSEPIPYSDYPAPEVVLQEYPADKEIKDLYNHPAAEKSSIYIQKIVEGDSVTMNIATFRLPDSGMVPVPPEEIYTTEYSDDEKEFALQQYREDSILMRKKINTLLMLNQMVEGLDKELGGNLVDATQDICKIPCSAVIDLATTEIANGRGLTNTIKGRTFTESGNMSLEHFVNDQFDRYFSAIRQQNGLSDRADNPVYNLVAAIRDGQGLAEKATTIIKGGEATKNPLIFLLKSAPELGRAIGSGAAAVNIYFQRKELLAQRMELLDDMNNLHIRMTENVRIMK